MNPLKLAFLLLLIAGVAWVLFNPDRLGISPPSLTDPPGQPIAIAPIDCGRRKPTVVTPFGNNLLVAYKNLNLVDVLNQMGERLNFFDPSPRIDLSIIDLHVDIQNSIVVVDGKSGSISVFDDRFNLCRIFLIEENGGAKPAAVTSKNDLLYVSDPWSGKVRVFSRDLVPIAVIPKNENEKLHPVDTLVTDDGLVMISDLKSAKIRVYGCDGRSAYVFDDPPQTGDGPGFLPARMALDSKGRVHVLDARSPAIAVFDRRGYFLFRYRRKGSRAVDIAVTADRIFVANPANHRIEVWKY